MITFLLLFKSFFYNATQFSSKKKGKMSMINSLKSRNVANNAFTLQLDEISTVIKP